MEEDSDDETHEAEKDDERLNIQACPKLIDRFEEKEENVKQTENITKGQIEINEQSPKWLLKQEVPKIVGMSSVLKELVVVLPDFLADHMGSLIPGIEKALSDRSFTSNLKIEALIFARLVLASHSPSALSSPVVSAVGERFYKVTAEALREVNECAISCMHLVVSTFGDNLDVELPVCLPVLVDRMGNEITQLTAVKANQPPRQATLWTRIP
ncbi:cullin-associated NEDD8-dissociated protein 1 [Prunus yedoensis var. nudiflora]|uniref:Cullin-associated NEDD8-dissociated protein 1 n=1 Tax=Prunus yedoensis var. nudiflora TaxID=2094558 RepID=A0A314UTX9_PRUYE|nr:cullin-associated NEDD8-dissociated protein 1 [Prunus yedoensis var. nudiflora]